MPSRIGRTALAVYSMPMRDLVTDSETQRYAAFLNALGASDRDVTLAIAAAIEQADGFRGSLSAIRVSDAPGSRVLEALVDQWNPEAVRSRLVLGGKEIVRLEVPGGDTQYLYPSGDTVFIVVAGGETSAATWLEALR